MFRDIKASMKSSAEYHRQMVCTSSSDFDSEGLLLPDLKPDFVVADVSNLPRPHTEPPEPTQLKWRQPGSFLEVKSRESDGPKPFIDRASTIKDLTAQGADYARLLLAVRPFHIFVIGIVIYGTKFRVGFFDRGGVLYSKEYDIFNQLDIFVRVVRRITCDLSPGSLGQDPSVRLADNHSYDQAEYPSFRVGMGGSDTRLWTTIGPPMWSSLSLFGRGTSVWLTYSDTFGTKHVLKVAWRAEARTAESSIYTQFPRHPGVAVFCSGGDVLFPSRTQAVKVSVQNVRQDVLKQNVTARYNLILHRVAIETIGRPLSDYKDEATLIIALQAAVKGV